VFIRHEFEQQGFQEMADELNITLNTLLSRKHYAIKYLRKRLKPLYDELFKQN
jgi:DNA-directed RNA polymerase specialized sigma24 family protein